MSLKFLVIQKETRLKESTRYSCMCWLQNLCPSFSHVCCATYIFLCEVVYWFQRTRAQTFLQRFKTFIEILSPIPGVRNISIRSEQKRVVAMLRSCCSWLFFLLKLVLFIWISLCLCRKLWQTHGVGGEVVAGKRWNFTMPLL